MSDAAPGARTVVTTDFFRVCQLNLILALVSGLSPLGVQQDRKTSSLVRL